MRTITRRTALVTLASAAAGIVVSATANAASTQSSLQYSVVKSGDGPKPELGDLVGIRFKGIYNGVVFDNLFEDKKPYFYRVGSGTILKVRVPIPNQCFQLRFLVLSPNYTSDEAVLF